MIAGVGVDVVEIGRFGTALERTPSLRGRLFTPTEAKLPLASLAARFAAKEALAKALGATAQLAWQDAEVIASDGHRPEFELRGTVRARTEELGIISTHLSMSHDGTIATAFVVAEC